MEKLEGKLADILAGMYEGLGKEIFLSIHKKAGVDSNTDIKIQGSAAGALWGAEKLLYECVREICIGVGNAEECKEKAKGFFYIVVKNLYERLEEETWNTQK